MTNEPDYIQLDHGSGGKIAHQLTTDLLLPMLENPLLAKLHDGAILDLGGGRTALSTDTFTVTPLFFAGGDIGDLAVNGTVNDVAMCGAKPLYLSLALIIEEGFAMADLKRILTSIAAAAAAADVKIVTGDTKVVPKGCADGIFINTTGIGLIPDGVCIGADRAVPGDKIVINGAIADHAITILTQREGLHMEADVRSDTAPLNHLVARMLAASRDIHVLRDPTRGGVGTALNENAVQSGVGIEIDEAAIAVIAAVAGACELLVFDPLYLANEGKLLAFVAPDAVDEVLAAMHRDPYGVQAAVIGEVVAGHPGKVFMQTLVGGSRLVGMLAGEQLPRIC